MTPTRDRLLRERIFADLTQMLSRTDGTLSWEQLLSYSIDGSPLPLIDRSRGIRNPQIMDATLSVVSSASGPYPDREVMPGVWEYSFRSGSDAGDNTKLIAAHDLGAEIILFHKSLPKVYLPIFPVKVVGVDRVRGIVTLAISELAGIDPASASVIEREWAQVQATRRVHQPAFRALVLRAYETQCTVCRFRHAELLDAAHIVPDKHELGDARASNGMSMCKIHHAAYDRNFLGVTPDFEVRINTGLLEEVDGPMLRHGLQEMHGQRLTLPARPADRPDTERLALRYEQFLASTS